MLKMSPFVITSPHYYTIPRNKVRKVHMGPTWGRQDQGGPDVGPMNLAIRDLTVVYRHLTCVATTVGATLHICLAVTIFSAPLKTSTGYSGRKERTKTWKRNLDMMLLSSSNQNIISWYIIMINLEFDVSESRILLYIFRIKCIETLPRWFWI